MITQRTNKQSKGKKGTNIESINSLRQEKNL